MPANELTEFEIAYNKYYDVFSELKNYPCVSRSRLTDATFLLNPTKEQLDTLYAMKQSEATCFLDENIELCGGMERIDSLNQIAYLEKFNILGGHEGMERLMDFSQKYLKVPQGLSCLSQYLGGLKPSQIDVYAQQAAFIDSSVRPICSYVEGKSIKEDMSLLGEGSPCDLLLKIDLMIAGANIQQEALFDLITGGTYSPLFFTVAGVNLLKVFLDYQACRGRIVL